MATEAPTLPGMDVRELLDWLGSLDDDLRCQARHGDRNWSTKCSITVTHRARLTCNGVTYNLCANEAAFTAKCIAEGVQCAHCNRLLSICWRVNPI